MIITSNKVMRSFEENIWKGTSIQVNCTCVFLEVDVHAKSLQSCLTPAMQETHVQSLGWEDPLEKEIATHSCILDWRIPQTEEPGGLQSLGSQRVRHD